MNRTYTSKAPWMHRFLDKSMESKMPFVISGIDEEDAEYMRSKGWMVTEGTEMIDFNYYCRPPKEK